MFDTDPYEARVIRTGPSGTQAVLGFRRESAKGFFHALVLGGLMGPSDDIGVQKELVMDDRRYEIHAEGLAYPGLLTVTFRVFVYSLKLERLLCKARAEFSSW